MYAVIRSGGKQYRVAPGETVQVERLEGKVGHKVTFDEVLAVSNESKMLAGREAAKAKVIGKIVSHGRQPKRIVLKFKRTNQYKITRGHRQEYTAVQISDIQVE